jgi:hypothetical protein
MIFNKGNNGSEELKGLLGFIQASLSFDNLKTYINFSERELKKTIGRGIYELAYAHYVSDNYESEDDEGSGSGSGMAPSNEMLTELVQKIQLPVAFHAYISYAKSADLTHSDKGRQIFVSENEKPAFEWMVRQDEDNILSLAYQATDDLLDFLMENREYFPEWTGSDAYTEALSLCINRAEDFNKIFPIDKSRRMFLELVPFIKEAERKYIRPCVGKEDFDALKAKIITGDMDEDDEELLSLINVPLALFAMGIAVRRLPVKVLSSGIFQNYDPEKNTLHARKPADKDVRVGFSVALEDDAREKLRDLQDYISKQDDAEYVPRDLTARHSEDNKFFRA